MIDKHLSIIVRFISNGKLMIKLTNIFYSWGFAFLIIKITYCSKTQQVAFCVHSIYLFVFKDTQENLVIILSMSSNCWKYRSARAGPDLLTTLYGPG